MSGDRAPMALVSFPVVGLLAWVWLGDWRWAVTGFLIFVLLVALASARQR